MTNLRIPLYLVIIPSIVLSANLISFIMSSPTSAQSRLLQTQVLSLENDPDGVKLSLSSSIGFGIVTGRVDEYPNRGVEPGYALTGAIKLLIVNRDPESRFGPGIILGLCTTLGTRKVKNSVDTNQEGIPFDGRYLGQSAIFIGPIIQLGRYGGRVRYQLGLTWNRSRWNTNLFTFIDPSPSAWKFLDDQVGAGAFVILTDNRFSCTLIYQELEARWKAPPDSQFAHSTPIVAKTTWMTIGISF